MFDPARVSYGELLDLALEAHDPCRRTSSTQYKAVVFFHDLAQRRTAEERLDAVGLARGMPIATELLPASTFYPAEDYHQKYSLRNNPEILAELEAYYPRPEDLAASTAAARLNGYLAGYGDAAQLESELSILGLSEKAGRDLLERVRRGR